MLNTLVESITSSMPAGGAQQDFRTLIGIIGANLQALSPGGNLIRPGGTAANSSSAPAGVSLHAQGANGVFTLAITNRNKTASTVFTEISYSAVKGFTSGVTTLPPSSSTSVTLNLPGQTYFFRVRASFDLVNWSGYTLASNTPIASGLVSSAATSNGGAFNQTNFLNVDSVAAGSTANVRIYGTAGPLNSGVAQKGVAQTQLPSATLVNVQPGATVFAGWNGRNYVLKPTLAAVLNDDLTPIGRVSVVGTGSPRLPTIVPIISGGGVVGFNVTDGGAGATAPYGLTISDPGEMGSGATAGQQSFAAGVLQSVAPGNAGENYGGHTVVAASGGTGPGTPGGGTAIGGNGGRLSAV